MSCRSALLVTVTAILALPGAASAAVRCVGASGGDCSSTHLTTADAVTAAVDGVDTVRFGTGSFGPVSTTKVLTWVGVGAGTPASATGASVIQGAAVGEPAMELPRGGTVRSLRAVGGPGAMSSAAGTGIEFFPSTNGDITLSVSDTIGIGGVPHPAANGGTGLATGSSPSTGTKVATVNGGAFLAGPEPDGRGLAVYTCCIRSSLTNTLIRARSGPGLYASLESTPTLEGSVVEGQTAIQTQAPTSLTLRRSRVTGSYTGIGMNSDTTTTTRVSVQDSLVTTGTEPGALAPVWIAANFGDPIVFDAVGSTFIGRGESQAAVHAERTADGSPAVTATLRNSVARNESGSGVDLFADRATIGADFSSFNTRTLQNGGVAPEPGSASNVAGDPLLAPDYSLQPGSPLIDRGDPALVSAGELDLAGAARSQDGNGDCQALPDIGAFERPNLCPPIVANVAPGLASVSMLRKVFAPTTKSGRISAKRKPRPKRGTRFRYTLSEPARMEIRIERALAGRRSGRRCVKPTRKNRKRRRCTRYSRVTTLRANELAGRQFTNFTGRVRRKALKPGRYRARLVATDTLGARSPERKLAFRIVKP